tara:strand:- start:392 stop:511 length:120 start_codon:yes stop_codon:yes gene_type:complete
MGPSEVISSRSFALIALIALYCEQIDQILKIVFLADFSE